MPVVDKSILIRGDLEEVYQTAKNVEEFPQFMPDVESVRIVERHGSTVISEWVGVVQEFRMKVRWTERDIWDDANHTCEFSLVKGDYEKYCGRWTFRPVDGQVEFRNVLEYEINVPLIGPLIKKLIDKKMNENVERMLAAIKKRVEG